MKIVLSSDHAGLDLREWLANELSKLGHETLEVGAKDLRSYDYPDASDELASLIQRKEAEMGILVCGTGIGVSIRANRYSFIRCALCTTEYMAEMAREHNDANVLALGARVLGTEQSLSIAKAFLNGKPSTVERHKKRVEKLSDPI